MSRPRKIALIGNANNVHLQRWSQQYRENGLEVSVISDQPGVGSEHNLQRFPTTVGRFPIETAINIFRARRRVKALIRQIKPDAVQAHFTNVYGWLGMWSGIRPTIQTIWGSDLMVALDPVQSWLNRRSWERADAVTVHSEYMATRLRQISPQLGPRLKVIRWGLDSQTFHPRIKPYPLRTYSGIDGKKIVFCPRTLRPVYDILSIIHAWAYVVKQYASSQLILTKYNADIRYADLVTTRIKALNLSDNVMMLDSIPHADMPGLYRAADCVVSMTTSEGLPISIVEALACGTRCIVADIPQVSELKNAPQCLTVPVGNVEALSSAIVEVLNRPIDLREQTTSVEYAQQWDFQRATKAMLQLMFNP